MLAFFSEKENSSEPKLAPIPPFPWNPPPIAFRCLNFIRFILMLERTSIYLPVFSADPSFTFFAFEHWSFFSVIKFPPFFELFFFSLVAFFSFLFYHM